ncbi:MAG: class I SAM-dependent methyltransferase [Phycisphaerales bacterium]|nr:class I SAM-dependent methyltransferase [Phycisphaerales bacterium]
MSLKRSIVGVLGRLGLVEAVNEARGLTTLLKPGVATRNTGYRKHGGPDGWPVPSARLVYLVAGTYDIQWFLTLGERGAATIRETLQRHDVAPDKFESVLDFGCGCGRVIRHFSGLGGVRVCGTDYNPRLVDWCARHLTFARFQTNDLAPPLSYDDRTFDFVYALSVFTHLDRDLQIAWIDELRRVVKPGGHLLLTMHGESYLPGLSDAERAVFHANQLVIRRAHLEGKNICTSFCTEKYVRDNLSRGGRFVDFVPEGAKGNPTQDLYLLRFEG